MKCTIQCEMLNCGVPWGLLFFCYAKYILHFALFTQFHQCVQQILQVLFSVEFQLKAALALAVDDLYATAQMLAERFFTLGNLVDFKGDFLFGRFLFIHVSAQSFCLPDRQSQRNDFLSGFHLLLFGLQS